MQSSPPGCFFYSSGIPWTKVSFKPLESWMEGIDHTRIKEQLRQMLCHRISTHARVVNDWKFGVIVQQVKTQRPHRVRQCRCSGHGNICDPLMKSMKAMSPSPGATPPSHSSMKVTKKSVPRELQCHFNMYRRSRPRRGIVDRARWWHRGLWHKHKGDFAADGLR